ncbi:unnamed protein product [Rotaria sp. Silwood1]|nr:unnamed protein product [Rotaria sp. Silwood1]
MYLKINESILVFIGWFIQASFELSCIQCTSPIRRISQNLNYSCLDGTLPPLPCILPANKSNTTFKACMSSLYRIERRKNGGKKNYIDSCVNILKK